MTLSQHNPKFICGPCKCADWILEVCQAKWVQSVKVVLSTYVSSIKELVDEQMKGDISVLNTSGPLYLDLDQKNEVLRKQVYMSPRVGWHRGHT